MVKIFYEDSDILVVEKPPGLDSQTGRGFAPDMVSEIKNYLKLSTGMSTKTAGKGGEPYVGVIHRLDKPVGGIMVYAKNPKSAASLSRQVQDGRLRKRYQAVVCGKPVDIVDNYVDYLLSDGKTNRSVVVDKETPGSKCARLNYRALWSREVKDPQNGLPLIVSLVETAARRPTEDYTLHLRKAASHARQTAPGSGDGGLSEARFPPGKL